MVDRRPLDTEYTVAFREGKVLPRVMATDNQGSHAPGGDTVALGKAPKRTPVPVARRPYFWEFAAGLRKDPNTGRPVQENAFAVARREQRRQQQQPLQQQQPHAPNPFELGALRQRPPPASMMMPPAAAQMQWAPAAEPAPKLSARSIGAQTCAVGTVGSTASSDRSLGGFSVVFAG